MLEYGPKEQLPRLKNSHVRKGRAANREYAPAEWRNAARFARNLFFSAISQHESSPMLGYGVIEQNQGIKELHARMVLTRGRNAPTEQVGRMPF